MDSKEYEENLDLILDPILSVKTEARPERSSFQPQQAYGKRTFDDMNATPIAKNKMIPSKTEKKHVTQSARPQNEVRRTAIQPMSNRPFINRAFKENAGVVAKGARPATGVDDVTNQKVDIVKKKVKVVP